jgi:hypothetical protein
MIKLVFCLRRLPTLSVSVFETFIDLPNSPLFFAREHLIVSVNPPHAG